MNVKKLLTYVVISLAPAMSVLFISCNKQAKCDYGKISFCISDGFSMTPIEDAEVVIPETGGRYRTDEEGYTEQISLPVLHDSEYDELMYNSSGRITVIVYAEGYTPYALLYARVFPNETREGVEIYMFPMDGSIPVFSVIEAPSQEWVEGLIELYPPSSQS